jgi:UDP:flavonoid glycosyltransferase YjiC (YdhE family)
MRGEVARILIQSFGSLGDVEPLLQLGVRLQRRGHAVVYATVPAYQARIEASGLAFVPVRPHLDPHDPELLRRSTHPLLGFRHLLRELALPNSADTLADTLPLARDADLLLLGSLALLGPLLHSLTGTPWLRAVLQPSLLLAPSDLPLLVDHPFAHALRRPPLAHPFRALLLAWSRRWAAPLIDLERRHGFHRRDHPIFAAEGSTGVLALFSERFAAHRSDWPDRTFAAGFPTGPHQPLPAAVAEFVRSGQAPLVITLGSASGARGRDLYAAGIRAARASRRRTVVLSDRRDAGEIPIGDDVLVAASAPYDALFPAAAALLHHGGIGVTAAALRAGTPSLIVPIGQDQPDNAARVAQLGAGRSLPLRSALAGALDAALADLLADRALQASAERLSERLQREDGLGAAANAIERVLRGGALDRRGRHDAAEARPDQ